MTGERQGQTPGQKERPGASAAFSRTQDARTTAPAVTSADLAPLRSAAQTAETSDGALLDRVALLIEQTRAVVAAQANAALTLMNWHIGRMIDVEVLKEGRAGYDQEIVATLSPQLTKRFGRGFNQSSLYRMIKFSQALPNVEIVATLSPILSWSHFREIIALPNAEARTFYASEAVARNLSVRELRHAVGRKAFERRGIADSQIPDGSAVPLDAFRDPMLLDVLGLRDTLGVAGSTRPPGRREPTPWPYFVHRSKPRPDRVTRTAQGRHCRRRVLDSTPPEGRARSADRDDLQGCSGADRPETSHRGGGGGPR